MSVLGSTVSDDLCVFRCRFPFPRREDTHPRLRPGDTAIFANLPAHKVGGIRKSVKAASKPRR